MPTSDELINQKYDVLRKRAQQEAMSGAQQQKEALQRRFASLGMLGGGESIKQEQLAGERGLQAAQKAREGIDVAKAGEQFQQQQIKEGREFQRAERLGSQSFAAQQSDLQRLFTANEAAKQRGFTAEQADIERAIQEEYFNINQGFKEMAFAHQIELDDFQKKMAINNADLDREIFAWNKDIAQQEMNKKGFLESILSDPVGSYLGIWKGIGQGGQTGIESGGRSIGSALGF